MSSDSQLSVGETEFSDDCSIASSFFGYGDTAAAGEPLGQNIESESKSYVSETTDEEHVMNNNKATEPEILSVSILPEVDFYKSQPFEIKIHSQN